MDLALLALLIMSVTTAKHLKKSGQLSASTKCRPKLHIIDHELVRDLFVGRQVGGNNASGMSSQLFLQQLSSDVNS